MGDVVEANGSFAYSVAARNPFGDNVYEYGAANEEDAEMALYDEATEILPDQEESGYILTGEQANGATDGGRYLDPRPLARLPSRIPSQTPEVPERILEPRPLFPPSLPPRTTLPTIIRPKTAPCVEVALVLYGILFCVLFGMVGWQSSSVHAGGHPAGEAGQSASNAGTVATAAPFGIEASPSASGAQRGLGQVSFFATAQVPHGWLVCDGQSVNASQYPALAAALLPRTSVPDLVSEGLYIRGGLTPGHLQNQSTAVNGLFGHTVADEDVHEDALFRYQAGENILPGQEVKSVSASSWRGSYRARVGFSPKIREVIFNSTESETRPPTIVLLPAIYALDN
jgi:hypothetical protein